MSETSTLIGYQGRTIDREALALVPTPLATETHRPIPHHEIVAALVETLGFRHIGVVRDEYAVSPDGMKMFGVLDLETEMHGCRFSIGVRNSHDKSMRLAMTCGYRVLVCSNCRELGTAPRFHLLSHGLEVALHPINSHGDRVEQGERLRVLRQDRSKVSAKGHVAANQHPITARHCEPHGFVVRIPDSN